MKTNLLLLVMICLGSAAVAQNRPPYLTKNLSGSSISNLYVRTSGGSITVSGATGEQPRVEVYVHGNNGMDMLSDQDIKKRLEENYTLEIGVVNNELRAVAKNKHEFSGWNWRKSLSISFKIFVPQNVASNLETSGGSIHLDNLSGNEKFSTSGGSMHIDHLTGTIYGRTSGGSIELRNSGNSIDLETSGGSITAENCNGKIRLETSGGSLHLNNLNGVVNAHTSGGSIQGNHVDGELMTGTSGGSINLTDMSCSLDASTSGGSISAQVKRVGKFVKLDCSAGHVNLELPGRLGMNLNLNANRINHPQNLNFNGEWNKDHVHGALNGGGVPVTVDAGSSHLDISFN